MSWLYSTFTNHRAPGSADPPAHGDFALLHCSSLPCRRLVCTPAHGMAHAMDQHTEASRLLAASPAVDSASITVEDVRALDGDGATQDDEAAFACFERVATTARACL